MTEAAKQHGDDFDPAEIKKLAGKIMGGSTKLGRDRLRHAMEKLGDEVATAIREPKAVYTPYFSLRIGNLSSVTSDEDLVRYFKSRGFDIDDASVMYDKANAHSKCFGYLNFTTKEEADRCLAEMNGSVVDDKQVFLGNTEEGEFDGGARVQASNLPMDFDQRRLRALFKHYGNVKSCKLEMDHDGTSRGIGYIQFASRTSARKAQSTLDGTRQGLTKQRI